MEALTLVPAMLLGGVAGSLINMVTTRLPAEGDPPVLGRPLRPRTHHPDAFAFVPWMGAWQRSTGGIDLPKLATDIAATALSATAVLLHDGWLDSVRTAVFVLLLLLILRIDWQRHLIFTITIAPAILIAIGFHALDSTRAVLWAVGAGVGAALVFALLFFLALILYRKRALGFGDVLLAGLIGAMAGESAHVAILLGMFLGAVGGLFLVAIRVRRRTDYIPYGAYLCLGAIIVILTP